MTETRIYNGKPVKLYKISDNDNYDGQLYSISKYKTELNGVAAENMDQYLHIHDYMQINYVYQGVGRHFINNQSMPIYKGDIFIIPPNVPHLILPIEGKTGQIIEFEFMPEFINANFKQIEHTESFLDFAYIEPFLVAENQVKPRLNLVGKVQTEVENILNEVILEDKNKKRGYELLIRSQLLKLLIIVGREFTENLENSKSRSIFERHRDSINSAVQYIYENYNKELNVEDVARKFLLSSSYFSYLFKSITSKTFTEYLVGFRISKAQDLLKNTNDKVVDICYSSGFNNINHFNRIFKQNIGMSPLAYRKSN